MPLFTPVYSLTVFAPRSVDPTEGTVLTPPAGALHTDPLKVSTSLATANSKPYLRVPQGRRGRMDPKTKEFDVGQLTLVVGDYPIDGLNDQGKRWFSQFIGGADGVDALLMCKVNVQESLDGQASTDLFTGRITSVKQTGALEYTVTLKDLTDDMKDEVFFQEPVHANVPYAFVGPLQPNSLQQSWMSAPTGPNIAAVRNGIVNGNYRYEVTLITPSDYEQTLLTKALFDLSIPSSRSADTGLSGAFSATLTFNLHFAYAVGGIRARFFDGAATRDYWLRTIDCKYYADEKKTRVTQFSVSKINPTDPDPALSVTYWFIKNGDFSDASCLFIDRIHPVTLLRNLLEGHYGLVNTAGVPQRAIPTDSISFATLEADTSYGTVTFRITGREERKDWLTKNLLVPFSLGVSVNSSGEVEVVDLRASTMPADLYTITDADLISVIESEGWQSVGDDAISRVDITYYVISKLRPKEDIREASGDMPDVPCAGIVETPQSAILLDIAPRTLDFGEKPLPLDFKGLHGISTGVLPANLPPGALLWFTQDVPAIAEKWANELATPFAQGGRYLALTCKRTTRTENIQVGTRNGVSISTMPDPLTKIHGGTRFAICIERNEDGPVVKFMYLDLGALTQAVTSLLLDPINNPADPNHSILQGVTPNADNDPVTIEYAVTDTTVTVQPDESNPNWWQAGVLLDPTQQLAINNLPANTRIWTRGMSTPAKVGSQVAASAWTYPAAGYVDTVAIPAPSNLLALAVGNLVVVTFVPADATLKTQVLLHLGAGFTGWTADDVQITVNPGGGAAPLAVLTLGATYTVGVRHVDQYGAAQTIVTTNVTVGGVALTAPRPAGLQVIVPSAIILALFPADATLQFKLERAADDGSGTAPNLSTALIIATNIPAGQARFEDNEPIDQKVWWYRLYHTFPGYVDSLPTAWVKAVAQFGTPPASGPILPIITEQKTQTSVLGTLTIPITDPQLRVTEVAFKSQIGTGAESAYVADITVPYQATVALVSGQKSTITYRVKGYGADGVLTTFVERTITFDTNNAYSLPRDVGFIMGGGLVGLLTTEPPLRFWTKDDYDVTEWTVSNDQTGSVQLKIEVATYANFPVFTEVMVTERPTITAARNNQHVLAAPVQIRGKTCYQLSIVSVTTQDRIELTFHGTRV